MNRIKKPKNDPKTISHDESKDYTNDESKSWTQKEEKKRAINSMKVRPKLDRKMYQTNNHKREPMAR